jgi:peptidoglycan hydrolase-like protein with peptidoglycan-binding domain
MQRTFANLLLLCLVLVVLIGSMATLAAEPSPRIKELQQGLAELGYDPGPADGFLGQKTRKAIMAFQKDHDLVVDGKYSGLLLFKVNVERNVAKEEATPEGRKRKEEKERLLTMSNEDLINLIEKAEKKEAERILNLLGERSLELPAQLLFDKIGVRGKAGDYVIFLALKGLYYPGSTEGIRQFQSDIGGAKTGELTLGQFRELSRRLTRFHDTPIYPVGGSLGELKILVFEGYASVKGTWILENEQIAYPVNEAKITCVHSQRECQLIQASVVVPSLDEDSKNYMLELNSQTYTIVSWGADEIVARGGGKCRTTLLTLNMNSNEVYEVTRNNETKECREEEFFSLPRLDKPRIARLVPGWKVTRDFWEKRRDVVGKYANPRVRQEVEATMKALQPKE